MSTTVGEFHFTERWNAFAGALAELTRELHRHGYGNEEVGEVIQHMTTWSLLNLGVLSMDDYERNTSRPS